MDKPPATIGKYRIERVLGRGGMGTVYEALDPVINRKLAVKIMIPGLADTPDLRARFMREAQAAGGLRHRNIVTVYDYGEDKGQPYIAMEFIEGTDLEKVIQGKEPHPLDWKVEVIRQLCEGLGYAHRSGIVHRDIKPANIRVTPEGEVKIMDFGIAHLQSSTMTKQGLVLGTVHYMAPEQLDGSKGAKGSDGPKVDPRADIFSVGAIAYELLAGKRPFDGDSLTAVMFKVMHEAPDPALLPRGEYSPGLEGIVLKALARNVDERYQTLDEMQAQLVKLGRDAAARPAAAPPGKDPTLALLQGALQQRSAGRTKQALHLAREALKLVPGHAGATALVAELEREEAGGQAAPARPAGAPAAAGEIGALRDELQAARRDGQLQKALSLAQRLLQLDPQDNGAQQAAAEIEGVIKEREVEQLCGVALSYVTDGDTELALKIAQRIEKMAPQNPRYLQLRKYLDEERARRVADAHVKSAQDQLAQGNIAAALEAAEEALAVAPEHALAREIRERTAVVLASQELRARKTGVPPAVAPPPPAAPPPVLPKAAEPAPPKAAEPAPKPAAPPPAPAPAKAIEPAPKPVAAPEPPPRPVPPPPAPASKDKAAAPPPVPESRPEPGPPPAVRPPTAPPPPPQPSAAPAPSAAKAAAAPPAPEPLPPLPEGNPSDPKAALLTEQGRMLLRERQPQKALPLLEEAAHIEPGHPGLQRVLDQTRLEARKDEVEKLNNTALDHFLKNNYAKAKKATEKVLALDPGNRKARDLLKILGPLA